jgi:hypothetical protein
VTDIWVCSKCYSLNRLRARKCYKCGALQSSATGQGAHLRAEQGILARTAVAYRSAWFRAFLAMACIVGTAVTGVLLLPSSIALTNWARDELALAVTGARVDHAELLEILNGAAVLGLARVAFVIAAVVFFAAWLSRVIMNIPALGGGQPTTTPSRAFVSSLIPIWNLWKVPAMVQDALYRVDPRAGGFFTVLVAWVGLVGSAVVDTLAGWYVNIRVEAAARNATSLEGFVAEAQGLLDGSMVVAIVTTSMSAVGAAGLVVVMAWIEIRSFARDGEIRAAAGV